MLISKILSKSQKLTPGIVTMCKVLVQTDALETKLKSITETKYRDQRDHKLAVSYFDKFPDYCQMIADAKSLARRSILIDNCGHNYIDLKREFNNIETVFIIDRETKQSVNRLTLIEFESENDAIRVMKQARHDQGFLPVTLNILRYDPGTNRNQKYQHQTTSFPIEYAKIVHKESHKIESKPYTNLIRENKMSLAVFKLKLMTLVSLERIICSGLLGEYELMPFGSSILDMGTDKGDLDIVITRKENHSLAVERAFSFNHKDQINSSCSWTHLDKSLKQDRTGTGSIIFWVETLLKEYMPLAVGHSVLSISKARVPIIKFTTYVTYIDCDLSFNLSLKPFRENPMETNYTSIVAAHLIYTLCRHNNLFAATAIYLRIFAKKVTITSKEAHCMTNFQFLSLILFYLQQVSLTGLNEVRDQLSEGGNRLGIQFGSGDSIVPPFKKLLNSDQAKKLTKVRLSEDQINNILPEIINGFFKFYSQFDFKKQSANLYDGRIERKPDNSELYVENPMNRSKNICRNVSRNALAHFIQQAEKFSS